MTSKLYLLCAYPYMSGPVIEGLMRHQADIEFLLDSGAFTAWNAGKPIHLDEYCKFLDDLPIKPWRYFALDVVGDPEKTMRNYEKMLERGYNPIPVFTPSQSFADIETYYQTTDIIGCGGLVDKYAKGSLPYLQKVMEKAKGRKVHLLGYTKPQYIKHFQPYSCDSSSWTRAQRFGTIDLYMGQGEYISFRRPDATKRPKQSILDAIRRLGYNPMDMTDEESWRGGNSKAVHMSARSWTKYMLDAKKAIGTKIFLAFGDTNQLERALKHYRYWRDV